MGWRGVPLDLALYLGQLLVLLSVNNLVNKKSFWLSTASEYQTYIPVSCGTAARGQQCQQTFWNVKIQTFILFAHPEAKSNFRALHTLLVPASTLAMQEIQDPGVP